MMIMCFSKSCGIRSRNERQYKLVHIKYFYNRSKNRDITIRRSTWLWLFMLMRHRRFFPPIIRFHCFLFFVFRESITWSSLFYIYSLFLFPFLILIYTIQHVKRCVGILFPSPFHVFLLILSRIRSPQCSVVENFVLDTSLLLFHHHNNTNGSVTNFNPWFRSISHTCSVRFTL